MSDLYLKSDIPVLVSAFPRPALKFPMALGSSTDFKRDPLLCSAVFRWTGSRPFPPVNEKFSV